MSYVVLVDWGSYPIPRECCLAYGPFPTAEDAHEWARWFNSGFREQLRLSVVRLGAPA